MDSNLITEFVKFKKLNTTTSKQLKQAAAEVLSFHSKQDGFINAELVQGSDNNEFVFIHHYESMEKINKVGLKIQSSKDFDLFKSLVDNESVVVSFHNQIMACAK